MSTALAFHAATKYTPENVGNHPSLDWDAVPMAWKDYAVESPVALAPYLPHDPNPFTGERSGIEAQAPAGIGPSGLSRLIYGSYGVTGVIPQAPRPTYLRAAPSAGGLYPTELYVVVRDWPELAPGLYGYHPLHHVLIPLWSDPAAATALDRACWGHAQVAAAPLSLVLTGVFQRSRWRYRERAYRRILLDCGHVAGNTLLLAPELDLRAGLTAAFDDLALATLLRIDPEIEGALAVLPINRPGERERPAWPILPSTIGGGGTTLDALHADSACSSARPRMPALADATAEALHTRHGWAAGTSLLAEALSPSPLFGRTFDAICGRRSTRAFARGQCPRDVLARILAAAYLPLEVQLGEQPAVAPDLLKSFVAVAGVDGIEEGVYYLAHHGLELRPVRRGPVRSSIRALCLGQDLGGEAVATVFHAVDLAAAVRRLGDRAYRAVHLDAGIIGQRLNLAALGEGLGASGIGGYFDDSTADLLGIPVDQAVIYITTIGLPAH